MIRAVGQIHAGIQFYSVIWAGHPEAKSIAEQDLVPLLEAPTPTACLVGGRLMGYQEFQRVITYHRLHRDTPLRNNIFAFNASRTRFFAYQFKPLVKFLDSPKHRLLVCDEVGLGKTIESGLILVEMRARADLRTVLVLCPSGLRDKWKLELRRRFDEDFRVLTADDFRSFLDEYEESPDRVTLNGIISYETLRTPANLGRLEDMLPSLDLVIADEAHHMRNFGTLTRRVGKSLAANAGAIVFLTATPVHLGNDNLFSLLNLLDEEDFPDLELARQRFEQNEPLVLAQRLMARLPPSAVQAKEALRATGDSNWLATAPALPRVIAALDALSSGTLPAADARTQTLAVQRDLADLNLLGQIFTRTRRRDVHTNVAKRRAVARELEFTPLERSFYDAITDFVRRQAKSAQHLPVVLQWRLNGIQRRAASSIHAMVQYYRQRSIEEGLDPEEDEEIEDHPRAKQDRHSLLQASAELSRIIATWPEDAADSKYDELHRLLLQMQTERGAFKLVVFAFFRATLEYLQRRLSADGTGVVLLHGDVPSVERSALIERFRTDPTVHVLLSSKVGSEGLDFQFCDTLVNYDLPWNPMEVEQRIGRLDRIGQESKVISIVNLWTIDTIEERILRRLYDRLGVFERSIGALEAVMGDVVRTLESDVLNKQLTPEEAERETERVALVLEAQSRAALDLENDAAKFVGADDYFNEEVAAIQANRRYVTGEQLRRFVTDFVQIHAPGTRLRYDPDAKRGTLVPDSTLRRFLQSQRVAGELVHLLSSGQDGMKFTFDAQVAFEEPALAFINVLHPLITAIVASYDQAVGERVSAQHIALRTDRLPQGTYVFVVYKLSVRGARTRHTMECVILNDALEPACDGSTAEGVLGEMVERGDEPPHGGAVLDVAVARAAVEKAEFVFVTRQGELRQQLESENDEFIERRAASLGQSYTKSTGKLRERLETARERGSEERYQRMLRGQLARLEAERDTKLARLDEMRGIQVEHQEVTAGLLEVLGG